MFAFAPGQGPSEHTAPLADTPGGLPAPGGVVLRSARWSYCSIASIVTPFGSTSGLMALSTTRRFMA